MDKRTRDHQKSQSLRVRKEIKLFQIFLTDDPDCGKYHLSGTIYWLVSKILMHWGGDVEKPKLAAVNIDGTTIHLGLDINCQGQVIL